MRTHRRRSFRARARWAAPLLLAGLVLLPAAQAPAGSALLDGMGGPRGYGEQVMARNDDGSSNLLDLPFAINFYGNVFEKFYVNNNGNLTFFAPLWNYTPQPFPITNQPTIAPYWADVDTRAEPPDPATNLVYVAAPNSDTVVVTWDQVGYYSRHIDKRNSFQAILRTRPDTGDPGNFDVEFRYNSLQWTTGDASGGSGGLGGTPAQAGFDAGDNTNFFVLPGSFTSDVLLLQDTSNVSPTTPGLWSFAIRNGTPPGATPDNPIMPVNIDNGFNFNFQIGNLNPVFVDPLVAVGYIYEINFGPNFQSVILPSLSFGDNLYDIYLDGVPLVTDWAAGDEFFFPTGGVDAFTVLGIEVPPGLDPTDPTAFVTGLTFTDIGTVDFDMTPVTTQYNPPIPEPATVLAVASALAALGGYIRKRRAA